MAPLSADEFDGLLRAAQAGDLEARNRLVEANQGLVVMIARGYRSRGLATGDLQQEGTLGLIRAIERYDPGRGVTFSTYATYWIREAILSAIAETASTVRLPVRMVRLMHRWRHAEQALARRTGVAPQFDEVADALGFSTPRRRYIACALAARRVEPLQPWQDCSENRDRVEAALEAADLASALPRWLGRLDDRSRTILALRYGLGGCTPMTCKEIGRRLGINRQWVSRLEVRALARLAEMAGVSRPCEDSTRTHHDR